MKNCVLIGVLFIALTGCKKTTDAPTSDKTEKPATNKENKATNDDNRTTKAVEPDKAPTKQEKPLKMAPLDLSAAGLKATIDAPAGAKAEDSFGTLEIKLGDGAAFFLQLETDAPDMTAIKKFHEGNTMQKLKKLHVETDDVIIAETNFVGQTSYWLDAKIMLGDKALHCKSGRGVPSFNRAQIDSFLKACQSLKAL